MAVLTRFYGILSENSHEKMIGFLKEQFPKEAAKQSNEKLITTLATNILRFYQQFPNVSIIEGAVDSISRFRSEFPKYYYEIIKSYALYVKDPNEFLKYIDCFETDRQKQELLLNRVVDSKSISFPESLPYLCALNQEKRVEILLKNIFLSLEILQPQLLSYMQPITEVTNFYFLGTRILTYDNTRIPHFITDKRIKKSKIIILTDLIFRGLNIREIFKYKEENKENKEIFFDKNIKEKDFADAIKIHNESRLKLQALLNKNLDEALATHQFPLELSSLVESYTGVDQNQLAQECWKERGQITLSPEPSNKEVSSRNGRGKDSGGPMILGDGAVC